MAKKKTNFWESALLNNRTYLQYYNRLLEMAVSMFEWKNLPETVDPRFLELCLYTDGRALFFEDEVLGKLALRCTFGGTRSVYNIPTVRNAFAVNGYHRSFDESNSVIIWNNSIHGNNMLDTEMFARRLYNIDRAIDINANAQKTPILIRCDENERLTFLNVYKEYDGNTPVIFGDRGLNAKDSFQVLNTGAPYVGDKLMQLKIQIWNEALTYLGISNVNFQKKERLIADEVSRQQGGTIASRYSRLNARRQACDEINRMFGLNIEVEFRDDFREMDDEFMLEGDTGNDDVTKVVNDLRTRTKAPEKANLGGGNNNE